VFKVYIVLVLYQNVFQDEKRFDPFVIYGDPYIKIQKGVGSKQFEDPNETIKVHISMYILI